MAGSARYTALLDANVLYPNLLRDLLVSLAVQGLFTAKWTERIHDEWTSALAKNLPESIPKLPRLRNLLNEAVPDCLVIDYEAQIDSLCLPDPDDRHVLAAAIVGHADTIVTLNIRDFPEGILRCYHIETSHPDDFIVNQLELAFPEALACIKRVRQRLKNPPISVEEYLEMIRKSGLPQTSQYLTSAHALLA